VLVEGYFDFAQVYQGGQHAVVASCGTALTSKQAALLHRFTAKVVLSYDPDAAGQGAAERSSELLVAEGFEVNVAQLPPGEDPDALIRRRGAAEYRERLTQSRPYLDFLLDRTAASHDLNTAEGRARLVEAMVPAGSRIPDTVRRQIFAESVSGRARVPHDVVLREFRKGAASHPKPDHTVKAQPTGPLTSAERSVLWMLVHRPELGVSALNNLESADIEGLGARTVLDLARKLNENNGFSLAMLIEQLGVADVSLVTEAAAAQEPPSLDVTSCIQALRKLRFERERAATQAEIDQLVRTGRSDDPAFNVLLEKHLNLRRRIESLVSAEE
jgi:DNA primase